MLYNFGAGSVFGIPVAGDLAANPTPIQFGTLQDISVDISSDQKELYGQLQYPVDTARGKSKVTWKAKFGTLNGKLVNDLFFAETISTPMTTVSLAEAAAIPGTPFSVTVTHSANFVLDLGVTNAATGVPLVRVASAPATGQYAVSAGVYTFAAADTGNSVLINYQYTAASGVGSSFTVQNRPMGYSPTFTLVLANQYQGNTFQLTLFNCRASKFGIATKNDDYTIPEFDGMAFANASSQILRWDIIGE